MAAFSEANEPQPIIAPPAGENEQVLPWVEVGADVPPTDTGAASRRGVVELPRNVEVVGERPGPVAVEQLHSANEAYIQLPGFIQPGEVDAQAVVAAQGVINPDKPEGPTAA